MSTSGETVFSLLEVISVLLTCLAFAGSREVGKPGLSPATFPRGRDCQVCCGFATSLGLRWGDRNPWQPYKLAGLAQLGEGWWKWETPASHSCIRWSLWLSSLPLAQREVCSPQLCTSVALYSPVCNSDKSHRQTLPARRTVALDCDLFIIQSAFLLASIIGWSLFKFAYFSNLSPSPLCSVIVIVSFSSPFLAFPYANWVFIKML